MRKATQNYILFVILLLFGLLEAVSGFVLWLALPCGSGGRRGTGVEDAAAFWGLPRDTWLNLHNWIGLALIVTVVIHLVLHWRWIVYMTKTYFKGRPSLRK